jgi:hypothetical protein
MPGLRCLFDRGRCLQAEGGTGRRTTSSSAAGLDSGGDQAAGAADPRLPVVRWRCRRPCPRQAGDAEGPGHGSVGGRGGEGGSQGFSFKISHVRQIGRRCLSRPGRHRRPNGRGRPRLPPKSPHCYTFAASRGAFHCWFTAGAGSQPRRFSSFHRVPRAEFCHCGPPAGATRDRPSGDRGVRDIAGLPRAGCRERVGRARGRRCGHDGSGAVGRMVASARRGAFRGRAGPHVRRRGPQVVSGLHPVFPGSPPLAPSCAASTGRSPGRAGRAVRRDGPALKPHST